MPLTRQHYRAFAQILGRHVDPVGTHAALIQDVYAYLKEDNPRFDAGRSRDAVLEVHCHDGTVYGKEE